MVYMANIVYGVAWILGNILSIYVIIVIISALLSWVNPDPYNPIVRFLRKTRLSPRWRIIAKRRRSAGKIEPVRKLPSIRRGRPSPRRRIKADIKR